MKINEFNFENEDQYLAAQDVLIEMHKAKPYKRVKGSFVVATIGDDEAVEFQHRLSALGIAPVSTKEGSVPDDCLETAML